MLKKSQRGAAHQIDEHLTVPVKEDKKFCRSKGRSQSKVNNFFEAVKSQDIFG